MKNFYICLFIILIQFKAHASNRSDCNEFINRFLKDKKIEQFSFTIPIETYSTFHNPGKLGDELIEVKNRTSYHSLAAVAMSYISQNGILKEIGPQQLIGIPSENAFTSIVLKKPIAFAIMDKLEKMIEISQLKSSMNYDRDSTLPFSEKFSFFIDDYVIGLSVTSKKNEVVIEVIKGSP
jgi:hypothetical protein